MDLSDKENMSNKLKMILFLTAKEVIEIYTEL